MGQEVNTVEVQAYSFALTLWKALWAYLTSVGVVGAADVATVGVPVSLDAFLAQWPVLVVALFPALWKVLENVRKNWCDDGKPLWEWPWKNLAPKTQASVKE